MATVVGISGEDWTINGTVTHPGAAAEGRLMNVRLANAIFDDENEDTIPNWEYPDTNEWDPQRHTDEVCAQLPLYAAHGLRLITVGLQGGYPGIVTGGNNQTPIATAFNSNGTLKTAWLDRLAQVIETCDPLGIIVNVNLFYFGQDHRLTNETAVIAGTDAVTDWLLNQGYTNVLVEIANEADQFYDHAILQAARVIELVERVQDRSSGALKASYSLLAGATPTNTNVGIVDFVLLHGNGPFTPTISTMVSTVKALSSWVADPKPIVFNEDATTTIPHLRTNVNSAVNNGASWGFHSSSFQAVPVDWALSTEEKRACFEEFVLVTGIPALPTLHGTVSTGIQATGTSALTISHTIGAGDNLCLYVFVGTDTGADDGPITATWNGTSMVRIGDVVGSSVNQNAAMFRLVNPDVGTFNVVINSANTTPSAFKTGTVLCFAGVHQSTPDGTVVSGGGLAAIVSREALSAPGGLVLDGACINGNPTLTVGGGQTQLSNYNAGSSGGNMHGTSTQPGSSGVTMSWTWSGNQRTAHIAVPINAAPVSGSEFQAAWAARTSHMLGGGVI